MDATCESGAVDMPRENVRSLVQQALGMSKAVSKAIASAVAFSAMTMVILAGCGASAAAARPEPLRVLSAAVTMNPTDYKGACSGKQNITFTAKLDANSNNLGGEVRYSWRIGYGVNDGVATFEKGQTTKTLTHTISFDIAPEADPYLAVDFTTSQPNVVAAPETRFDIACSVPL